MGKRKNEKITITDIAKLAGVSKMTVSRVMNSTGYVAPATRVKVEEIISRMDYHPSSVAQRMKGKIDKSIGVILTPRVMDETGDSFTYYSDMLRLLMYRATSCGFQVIVAAEDTPENEKLNYLKIIEENSVFGFILLDLTEHDSRLLVMEQKGVPVVILGSYVDHPHVYCVTQDNRKGGMLATQHLIEQGCKKIAFIGTSIILHHSTSLRLDGYRDALDKANIKEDKSLISLQESRSHEQSGYLAMKRLLEGSIIPEGVFCTSDLWAIGSLRAIEEAGLKVPDDIAIVGYDDLAIAHFTSPSLSTIHQPMDEMAETAVDILKNLYAGEEVPNKQIHVDNYLVKRKST